MTRIIQFIKLFLLSMFTKVKELWKRFLNHLFPQEASEELQDAIYIPPDKYDSIFLNKQKTQEILVSERVWDQIQKSVPNDLIIPNPNFLKIFKTMKADAYDIIFNNSPSIPYLYVDSLVWTKIRDNLPQEYSLPTPLFEKAIGPMRSEYYDNLFSSTLSSKLVVDNRVWESIVKNLPDSYILPNPNSKVPLQPPRDNSYSTILMKHQF